MWLLLLDVFRVCFSCDYPFAVNPVFPILRREQRMLCKVPPQFDDNRSLVEWFVSRFFPDWFCEPVEKYASCVRLICCL